MLPQKKKNDNDYCDSLFFVKKKKHFDFCVVVAAAREIFYLRSRVLKKIHSKAIICAQRTFFENGETNIIDRVLVRSRLCRFASETNIDSVFFRRNSF